MKCCFVYGCILNITDIPVLSGNYAVREHIFICDMIKRNELDVGHIVFEILAKTVFKFLCFILLLSLTNSS